MGGVEDWEGFTLGLGMGGGVALRTAPLEGGNGGGPALRGAAPAVGIGGAPGLAEGAGVGGGGEATMNCVEGELARKLEEKMQL